MFSTLLETSLKFSFKFILLSANALNLDQSKILSFSKELRNYFLERDFSESFQIMRNIPITVFCAPPTAVRMMTVENQFHNLRNCTLHRAVCGGEPVVRGFSLAEVDWLWQCRKFKMLTTRISFSELQMHWVC